MSTSKGREAVVVWYKAVKSNGTGACVEVGREGDVVLVRDSKNPDGPVLNYTRMEWAAFLDGAKNGEFDRFCN